MGAPFQPQNLTAEQADGNILLSWSASLGATGYKIQRSPDGVNWTDVTTVGQVTQFVDPYPGSGVWWWYQIAAVNSAGQSAYSISASIIAAPPAEMSFWEMGLRARQCADRVGSNFVTNDELNSMLRLAMYELYDILMTTYEDYFASSYVVIPTNGQIANYPLPDGATNYLGGVFGGTSGTPAPAFYKLAGMDLNVNSSPLTPSRVTMLRYEFIKRNQYVYPNSTSTIYGVYNMRYRLMGNNINIIPTPAGNQTLIAWYSPRLSGLLKATDLTTIGISGWLRYPIVRAAKYILDKEEGTDTSKLDAELDTLNKRIISAAQGRDTGIPEKISETRQDPIFGGVGFGSGGGGQAGW
jgi:hypothetical protein